MIKKDSTIFKLIKEELHRQTSGVELIASEKVNIAINKELEATINRNNIFKFI